MSDGAAPDGVEAEVPQEFVEAPGEESEAPLPADDGPEESPVVPNEPSAAEDAATADEAEQQDAAEADAEEPTQQDGADGAANDDGDGAADAVNTETATAETTTDPTQAEAGEPDADVRDEADEGESREASEAEDTMAASLAADAAEDAESAPGETAQAAETSEQPQEGVAAASPAPADAEWQAPEEQEAPMEAEASLAQYADPDADLKAPPLCNAVFRGPGARVFADTISIRAPVERIVAHVAKRLELPVQVLELRDAGATLLNSQTFEELGADAGSQMELTVVVDEVLLNEVHARQAAAEQAAVNLAESRIQVHVDLGPHEGKRLINVHIDRSSLARKPYLGGYRHKTARTLYHHAVTQTPRHVSAKGPERFTRETQTVERKTRSTQNTREFGTQMERPGLLLDLSHDVEKKPGKYFSAEDLERLRIRMTIVIQRHARGWAARRRANVLRQHRDEMLAFLEEQEQNNRVKAERRRKREIERRMHPQTAEDFEVLYNELEAWRLQETRKIKLSEASAADKQAALQTLLHKETRLLQTIDRLKQTAAIGNKASRINSTLRDLSKPKVWDLANGQTVEVCTPLTTRARELMHLYKGLNLPLLTVDERLDVLLHVKWTVKEFDCNLTREIVDLIDREADLLNRGRSVMTLEGLRKRIAGLFLAFIETPEFNPEAARIQVIPQSAQDYVYETLDVSVSRAPALAS